MSTRSSARNLFPPLDNPELTIRRRSRTDPTLLNDFEMAAEGPRDLQVPDLRTMEELCQPFLNGRGGPIAPIANQATSFGLKNDMIQQVHNSCQYHGLSGDDANKHLDKFLHVTQIIKVNGVTDDTLRLYLFPHSLIHQVTAWFDRLPRNSINTFEQMAKMFLGKYFPPSMVTKLKNEITNFRQRPDESLFEAWERYKLSIDRCIKTPSMLQLEELLCRRPEECYELIENMTAHHNHKNTLETRDKTSRNISSTTTTTTESPEVVRQLEMINKNFLDLMRQMQLVKSMDPKCETFGGPHSYTECPAIDGYTQEAAYATTANPRGDLKAISTRSGVAYDGPTILPTPSPLSEVVERKTKATKDK
nr:hypothetical protein [Tanacetum cinerariifolium]